MFETGEIQSFVQESGKNSVEEEKDKIEVTKTDCGKIVIQVNLSKESLQNNEIGQIIREIFELAKHDVEVEKVALPNGENSWQVRKVESSCGRETATASVDLTDKRRKTTGMKLMKHTKLYKIKLPKSLSRSRLGSKRKLSEKLSPEFDISQVHPSPAITNLLSQLYPNPYNLISLMEVQKNSKPSACKGAVDARNSCKIRFKARDAFCKGSDIEQEYAMCSAPSAPVMKISDKKLENLHEGRTGENKSGEKDVQKKESAVEGDIFKFTGLNHTQNNAEDIENKQCRKVKRIKMTSVEIPTGCDDSDPSQEACPESKNREKDETATMNRANSNLTISPGTDNRKRTEMTKTESKITKKKVLKAANPTEGDKIKRSSVKVVPPNGEKVSISTIHPMSLQRATVGSDESKDREKLNRQQMENKRTTDKDPKAVLKPMTAKKKCVIQYLKLIKQMYEAEERCLRSKMDDAWNFALDQMEKSEKKPTKSSTTRKNQQAVQQATKEQEKFKHSQSQTPKPKKVIAVKKKSVPKVGQKSEEPTVEDKKAVNENTEVIQPKVEFTERKKDEKPEENILLLRMADKEKTGPSYSYLENQQRNSQLSLLNSPCCSFGIYTKNPDSIRMGKFVFRRKIPKSESTNTGELPIEVINRNVLETNRKIDLLIRHIDNSMDWLSQTEKAEPSNMSLLIEKAKDLSEKLEENLRTPEPRLMPSPENNKESLRLYENKNLSCNRSDLLLAPSYRSLHIIPLDRGVSTVRIRTGAFFNNDFAGSRNRDCLWLAPDTIRRPSLGKLILPQSRSVNYLTSDDKKIIQNVIIPGGGQRCFERSAIRSEVPEMRNPTEPMLILVENTNEIGSIAENANRRDQNWSNDSEGMKFDLAGLNYRSNDNICRVEPQNMSPSSLSVNVIALDESMSAIRPVVMQEIVWGFPVPAPSPVMRTHYRNERHIMFTTMEASVLHAARTTSFMDSALMSVAQVVEQEPKQQSSVIISLHKCSGFVKNNDEPDESGKVCKFVVLPSDVHFTERSTENVAAWDGEMPGRETSESGTDRELKERGPCNWGPFRSESSMEMYSGDKAGISKMDGLLKRSNKLDRYGKNLTWFHLLPDPYESNPADEDGETPDVKQTNFRAIRNGPHQALVRCGEQGIFPNLNDSDRRKLKFDGSTPPIFRYLSSETSNTSFDEKNENAMLDVRKKGERSRKNSKFSSANNPLFPDIKKGGDNTTLVEEREPRQEEKQEDENDSSSTSSFKSSNDFSDVSELPELSYPKKIPKSRSHFLDKLFHELRSFRKCLTRRKGSKRKSAQDESNEFEDALSELNADTQRDNKVLVSKEKQTTDEAVNSVCIGEVGSHATPRKIFKTSFRGKESVTELMIDLKDVSISEVSDISVEKRKLSSDHTKISIMISKPSGENGAICCCTNQCYRKGEGGPSRKGSNHSLKNAGKANCLGWKSDATKSDDDVEDDDDDYKSVDSGTQSCSLENIPDGKLEDETDFRAKMLIRDALIEPQMRAKTFGRHKFDFYKKMESTTSSFDSLKLDGKEVLFSKYEKEMAPLKKALEDMQFRVHNIQNNTFCTSDEYYERALRLAKMSAGYCRSCKSKTIIPEDPLGIYQKLIPRTSLRNPYSKHRKYYFKATSSTNSSFYSIHSSNSDVSDKFCHLNSSSSIVTNELSRSRRPLLRESTNSNIPLFFGRTLHF